MSNIPAVTGKKMISALKKVGFSVARIKGSHHFLIHPDGNRHKRKQINYLII